MSTSTQDIFGDAEGARPASPGTYGIAPRDFRLPEATRLGQVRLQIADLDRSLAFYESVLGMRVQRREISVAVLGAPGDERPLVELVELAGARPAPRRGRLGLFHFAILLPDRPALGRFVRHLMEAGVPAGAADHLVSESLYLQDPDNLGVEIYSDRPRAEWRRVGRQLVMATDPFDFEAVANAGGSAPWAGMPAGTVMGHVHLHVGEISKASEFYSEALGFDRTVWQYPGALFLAAGGYHHHLGTNIWAGSTATPPTARDAQLLEWTIELPTADDIAAVSSSLVRAGHAPERDGQAITIHDPWGIQVRVQATR
jgi:catechol 2,3-dioxygenase